MRYDCPQLRAKAERDRKRQAGLGRWEEKKKAQEEEAAQREKQKRINRSELAVGAGGKTIPIWLFTGR